MAAQLTVTSRAMLRGDLAASGRDCAKLGIVVADAQAAPPVPDAKSQRFWAMAQSNFETAAADCQTGASN